MPAPFFAFAALAVAAQRPSIDSSAVARVLTLLKAADSTVCELAAQTVGNSWGMRWESDLLPTPMPMPMMMHLNRRAHHLRVHVRHGWVWRGDDSATLGAFRAVLRDEGRCVRNLAARVLGRARAAGSYDAFLGLLGDTSPGLRETGALGPSEIGERRAQIG